MIRFLTAMFVVAGVVAIDSSLVQTSEAREAIILSPLIQATPALPAVKPADKKPAEEAAPFVPPEPEVPLPLGTVRVHLHDGSVITGILGDEFIEVETQFGSLKVPVDKITSFTPGLDSQTDRMESLKKLIEELGDKSYSTRDKAEKKLLMMGTKIRGELLLHRTDKNAERRNRVQKLLATIDEMAEDDPQPVENATNSQPWRRLDTVVTRPFTLAGRIQQKQFTLNSKYGKLNIALADIHRVERPRSGREAYRRSVEVAGTNIAPRQFKNSHVAVQVGDRVTIKSDGVLRMTPWGSSAVSTPDGAPNYGWYINAKIPSGALVMRVGNTGEVLKIGSKHSFTAKKAGTLHFGIGMNASYVNHSFPGAYNLKIRVQPAGS
jgi:hypothetical protein